MLQEIIIDDFKFWIENDVIYCKVYSLFDKHRDEQIIERIFSYAISTLSEDKYLPILINLRELNHKQSLKAFKYLAKNPEIKSLVLSKTFLVNSLRWKIFLILFDLTYHPTFLNAVYKDINYARRDCQRNYKMFYNRV